MTDSNYYTRFSVEGWESHGTRSMQRVGEQELRQLGLNGGSTNLSDLVNGASSVLQRQDLQDEPVQLMTGPPGGYEAGIRKVLVIGKSGIGKTSAMNGELVNGTVKKAKGAKAGGKAGTKKVEEPKKVTIWGTDTQVYVIDTPGMFQTAMLKTFLKGSSTRTDHILMCVDAANRITLENALTEVFTANTITREEFNNNDRFAVLFLRMNVGEMYFNMSGEEFSEDIVRQNFVDEMTRMLESNYQKRTTYFYSYGGEEESKKRGREHWVKEFAAWIEQSSVEGDVEIDTSKVKQNPQKFLQDVVGQVAPECREEAEKFIKDTCCSQFWGIFGY